jgi:uncharacterized protein (DUF3084 family)
MRVDEQSSIYDREVENPELERALEEREKLRERKAKATKNYVEAHELVTALVTELALDDAPVRVGRFVLSRREVAGRQVAFETSPSSRLQIQLIPDEAAF